MCVNDDTGSVACICVTWANLSIMGDYTRHVSINGDGSKCEAGAARIDVSKASNNGDVYIEEKQNSEKSLNIVFIGL